MRVPLTIHTYTEPTCQKSIFAFSPPRLTHLYLRNDHQSTPYLGNPKMIKVPVKLKRASLLYLAEEATTVRCRDRGGCIACISFMHRLRHSCKSPISRGSWPDGDSEEISHRQYARRRGSEAKFLNPFIFKVFPKIHDSNSEA